jgi:2-polyprenyl-3-methyl-5-hydroxy-6-metoxy-1,4-benzoquinol methylase
VTDLPELAALRERMYRSYATDHAGTGTPGATALIYRRDIRPLLPPPTAGDVLDIGCGQGELVRCLARDGYAAHGIDISPEQVTLANAAGLSQVSLGDYRDELRRRSGTLVAVTACDFLEHLTKAEALEAFDHIAAALAPGGVLIARVPNAVSALGGHIRHGDLTHETWYSAQIVRQLAAAAGFATARIGACPPVAHGVASAMRALAWKPISGLLKLALIIETGQRSGHIVTQNLTFAARKGGGAPGGRAAWTAGRTASPR